VALLVVLSLGMLAIRSHLDIATVGLVLVVPVVVGAVLGGLSSGVVAVVGGFLVYDLLFIQPYYTFSVGRPENWTPLAVYVVVMILTARATSHLWRAEANATRRELEAERLFELSELVMEDRGLPELLQTIVETVNEAFQVEGVVLLLPAEGEEGALEVVASAGRQMTDDEIRRIIPTPGVAASLGRREAFEAGARTGVLRTLGLSAAGRPIGLLGLAGLRISGDSERLLATFGHHLAIALERAQIKQAAVRIGVLEEVDQLRRSLVGAVSHDLRSPLSAIKTAASTLRNATRPVGELDREELLRLIEDQTDRLTRLVSNLLDMSRIQSNSLVIRPQTLEVAAFLEGAVSAVGPAAAERVVIADPVGIPAVSVDPVLMTEVLVNLLENALRYSPPGSPVSVETSAVQDGQGATSVLVCVCDQGPGIHAAERPHIFERARRVGSGGTGGEMSGGAGIGLSIARAFTEAHHASIWLESPSQGGARFCFSMPVDTKTAGV
jgi:K+-sensing histidine kinase KdpD